MWVIERIPTPEFLRSQLDEAVTKLTAALPSAVLVVAPESLNAALAVTQALRPRLERDQAFLMGLAPKLGAPVSDRNMRARADEVLATANVCGVRSRSL